MIAFFDASALIYLIEGNEPFAGKVRRELAAVAKKHPDLGAAVSRLTWLECRVGPMKANDSVTLAAYDPPIATVMLVVTPTLMVLNPVTTGSAVRPFVLPR